MVLEHTVRTIDDFTLDDIRIVGYDRSPGIQGADRGLMGSSASPPSVATV